MQLLQGYDVGRLVPPHPLPFFAGAALLLALAAVFALQRRVRGRISFTLAYTVLALLLLGLGIEERFRPLWRIGWWIFAFVAVLVAARAAELLWRARHLRTEKSTGDQDNARNFR